MAKSTFGVLTCLLALVGVASAIGQGQAPTISAHKLGSFVSPDGKYCARVTLGEAEVASLSLNAVGAAKGAPALASETDVTGVLWDPAQPHRLIYSESGAYGTGKIAVWNDGGQKIVWKNDVNIDHLTWDRRNHRLHFHTVDLDRPNRQHNHAISFD